VHAAFDRIAVAERHGIPAWAGVAIAGLSALLALLVLVLWNGSGMVSVPVALPSLPRLETPVKVWLSTADQRLLLARQPDVVPDAGGDPATAELVVDLGQHYQTMAGFGAALTDSSAWLLYNQLGSGQRAALLRDLFGPPPGLNFKLLRLSIGASDFSLHHYTLDDMPAGQVDPQLEHFNLAAAQPAVVPVVRELLAIDPLLRIIASPWSAPAWMKTSANLIGGTLLEQYEPTYAAYLARYVESMRALGIPIFALTVQNEPAFEPLTYPGMLLSAAARARIIGQYLGPMLAGEASPPVILGWDHNWDEPDQPMTVLSDLDAARYMGGVAWHCYRGSPAAQTEVHRAFPRRDVYLSECSSGDWASIRKDRLLWYTRDVLMASMKNWAGGLLYWNVALDQRHGPHAGGCDACTGIVTIDTPQSAVVAAMRGTATQLDALHAKGGHSEAFDAALGVTDELLQHAITLGEPAAVVHRNVEYYAFAHFSRYVLPGAVRVKSTSSVTGVDSVAFRNADGGTAVLVVVNSEPRQQVLAVSQGALRFHYPLPPHSMATFVWQPAAAGVTPAPAPAPAPASSSPWLPPIPLPPLPVPDMAIASSAYGPPQ
jgi:glucosylceramidase